MADAIVVGMRSIKVPRGRNAAVIRISTAVSRNAPTASPMDTPDEAAINAAPGVDQAVTIGMRWCTLKIAVVAITETHSIATQEDV